MMVDPSMLEAFVRSNLKVSAKRTMVVLELLKVKLINAKDLKKKLKVPDFPDSPEMGSHKVTLGQKFTSNKEISNRLGRKATDASRLASVTPASSRRPSTLRRGMGKWWRWK